MGLPRRERVLAGIPIAPPNRRRQPGVALADWNCEGDVIAPGATGDVVERAVHNGRSTECATTTAIPDGGTTATGGSLPLVEIHADAAGHDRENLEDEYIVL
jgi:hypothetical protein